MIVPNPDVPGGEQVKILDFGIAEVRLGVRDGAAAPTRPCGTGAERLPA